MELDFKKVNILMIKKNMRNKDLAKRLNVGESTVSKLLNGSSKKPRKDTIFNLSKALEVDVEEIIKED